MQKFIPLLDTNAGGKSIMVDTDALTPALGMSFNPAAGSFASMNRTSMYFKLQQTGTNDPQVLSGSCMPSRNGVGIYTVYPGLGSVFSDAIDDGVVITATLEYGATAFVVKATYVSGSIAVHTYDKDGNAVDIGGIIQIVLSYKKVVFLVTSPLVIEGSHGANELFSSDSTAQFQWGLNSLDVATALKGRYATLQWSADYGTTWNNLYTDVLLYDDSMDYDAQGQAFRGIPIIPGATTVEDFWLRLVLNDDPSIMLYSVDCSYTVG